MSDRFFANPESILGTLARLFASDGAPREVAILAHSAPELVQTGWDDWNSEEHTYYTLHLNLPMLLYTQVEKDAEELEASIKDRLQVLLKQYENEHVTKVS